MLGSVCLTNSWSPVCHLCCIAGLFWRSSVHDSHHWCWCILATQRNPDLSLLACVLLRCLCRSRISLAFSLSQGMEFNRSRTEASHQSQKSCLTRWFNRVASAPNLFRDRPASRFLDAWRSQRNDGSRQAARCWLEASNQTNRVYRRIFCHGTCLNRAEIRNLFAPSEHPAPVCSWHSNGYYCLYWIELVDDSDELLVILKRSSQTLSLWLRREYRNPTKVVLLYCL